MFPVDRFAICASHEIEKAKMPRTKPRLPTIPKQGDWDPFTSAQCERIEMAYGQGPLPEEVWLKLQQATALYTAAAPLELALPLEQFVSKLDALREAADAVKRIMPPFEFPTTQVPIDPKLSGRARLNALQKTYFQRRTFRTAPLLPFSLLELLNHSLNALDKVCEAVCDEFGEEKYPAYKHGQLWSYWVFWLTIILREHGLPYEARKDSDKRKIEGSPFVLFLEELQQCAPPQCRQSTVSRDALAQAINRARRGLDLNCKFSDVIDLDIFRSDGNMFIGPLDSDDGRRVVAIAAPRGRRAAAPDKA
jgi:hypothetical protein